METISPAEALWSILRYCLIHLWHACTLAVIEGEQQQAAQHSMAGGNVLGLANSPDSHCYRKQTPHGFVFDHTVSSRSGQG